MRVVTPWLDLPNVPDAWCRRLTACPAGAQTAGAFFPRPRHEITQVLSLIHIYQHTADGRNAQGIP